MWVTSNRSLLPLGGIHPPFCLIRVRRGSKYVYSLLSLQYLLFLSVFFSGGGGGEVHRVAGGIIRVRGFLSPFTGAFTQTFEQNGKLDIVCNNAGINEGKDWQKTIDLNLVGVTSVPSLISKLLQNRWNLTPS